MNKDLASVPSYVASADVGVEEGGVRTESALVMHNAAQQVVPAYDDSIDLMTATIQEMSLKHSLLHRRDFYAGCLMVLFGLFAALNGPNYTLGTLMRMGPGFLPTALGVILICLGVIIAGTAATTAAPDAEDQRFLPEPQWLGWLCILAGPLAFILFGKLGGMIPGTFACVFISALGDRDATWKGALVLAAGVTVFGVLLFHCLLKIPMPILHWITP